MHRSHRRPALDDLAVAAQSRDSARAELCATCSEEVRRYFDRALGGRHDAEDATQEVVLRVLEALPRFRAGDSTFRSWLFTIAQNVAIDRARRAAHGAIATAPADLARAQEGGGAATQAGVSARDSFRELISALPHVQQQAVTLVYVHDLTSEQAAHVLGRSPASVRKSVERARGWLRAHLAVDVELWA